MTGVYGANDDAAAFRIDGMGVGWPARKVLAPIACVLPSISKMQIYFKSSLNWLFPLEMA
jgi:hypothetical protein